MIYICKKFNNCRFECDCHAMQGHISLKSAVGQGTCFTLMLPFMVSERISDKPDLSTGGSMTLSHKPRHVLIIEDNKIAAVAVQIMLKPFNCTTDIAETGTEAIEKATQNHYDLVFADIGLPDMDGTEVSKAIRLLQDSQKASVPIVALTGHADDPIIRQQCFDAGMQEVINKPAHRTLLDKIFQELV